MTTTIDNNYLDDEQTQNQNQDVAARVLAEAGQQEKNPKAQSQSRKIPKAVKDWSKTGQNALRYYNGGILKLADLGLAGQVVAGLVQERVAKWREETLTVMRSGSVARRLAVAAQVAVPTGM